MQKEAAKSRRNAKKSVISKIQKDLSKSTNARRLTYVGFARQRDQRDVGSVSASPGWRPSLPRRASPPARNERITSAECRHSPPSLPTRMWRNQRDAGPIAASRGWRARSGIRIDSGPIRGSASAGADFPHPRPFPHECGGREPASVTLDPHRFARLRIKELAGEKSPHPQPFPHECGGNSVTLDPCRLRRADGGR
jgi:hypothetical protein